MIEQVIVPSSPGLENLISDIFGNDPFNSKSVTIIVNAPYFVYNESRIKQDEHSSMSINVYKMHVSESNQAVLTRSQTRDLIDVSFEYIGRNHKGDILLAFAEIEFLIDILICHSLGIYEDQRTFDEVKELCFEERGLTPNFSSKKKYLYLKSIINKDLYDLLSKVQKIRNSIAHGYFSENNLGLKSSQASKGENLGEVVSNIYNLTWLQLLVVYSRVQVEVLEWVKLKIEHQWLTTKGI